MKNSVKPNQIKSFYSTHSKSEFEAVFRYPLFDKKSQESSNNTFDLQAYIIYPIVLDVSADHYSKDDFYKDLKAMVRLRQPKLNFAELMGNEDATPLDYLSNLLTQKDLSKNPKIIQQAKDEAKLFGVSFNRHIYRTIRKKTQQIKFENTKQSGNIELLLKEVIKTLDKGELALKEWSSLVSDLKNSQHISSKSFLQIVSAVEEYCYYVYLDSCAYIEDALSTLEGGSEYKDFITKIHQHCERAHHVATESFSYPEGEDPSHKDLQNYGIRRGALKKNIQSVLYLNARSQPFFVISKQLGAMVAAGIAAAWAISMEIAIIIKTGLGGFSKEGFGLSTMILVSAFVFAYILKDRIKEFGRKKFRRGIFFKVPDNRNKIIYSTSDGQKINVGRLDESMEYVPHKKIPMDLQKIMNKNRIFDMQDEHVILSYQKSFSINAKSLRERDSKLTSAHDIFRYNFSRFLPFLDEPVEKLSAYFDSQTIGKWLIPKSYYFDVLFMNKLKTGKNVFFENQEAVRIFVNKKGIIKVKRLDIT